MPMDPTTRRHIPEDHNRDVLSRRHELKPISSGRNSSSTQNLPESASLLIVPGKLISPTSPKSQQHDNIRQPDDANQRNTLSKVIRQQDSRRTFDSRKEQYSFVLPKRVQTDPGSSAARDVRWV